MTTPTKEDVERLVAVLGGTYVTAVRSNYEILGSRPITTVNKAVWEAALALRALQAENERLREDAARLVEARPESEWHEDHGDVLWWRFPLDEPPYVGSPLHDDWPGYHTHWTPLPGVVAPRAAETDGGGA